MPAPAQTRINAGLYRIYCRGSLFAVIVLASLLLVLNSLNAHAQGDLADGEKVFKKCKICHRIGPQAKNAVGPVLTGIVGRQAGTFDGYRYGKSMIKAGEEGLIWDEELIFAYLENPTAFLRELLNDRKARGKMPFKLPKAEDRLSVITYLKSFSPAPDDAGALEAGDTGAVPDG